MTDEDDVLEELAKLAREKRRAVDPRWEALARGELGDREREELLAEEGDELLPLFEPLGDDFANQAADRILARRQEERVPGGAEVVRPAFGRARWLTVLAPALALAAAALLYVATLDPASSLPEYTVEGEGGDRALRGTPADSGPVRLSAGSRVEIVGRPQERAAGPVDAAVVVRTTEGEEPWTGRLDVSESGAVRLTGIIGQDLALPTGPAEVVITLRLRQNGDDGAQVLSVPILVVD
jgi:hypothetical protein